MSRKRKTNGTRTGGNPGSSHIHRRVKAMAAAGLVEDQIALRIGGDKNQLRRKYIESIKAGREAKAREKAEAKAAELSKAEREQIERIEATFASDWYDPESGNLLYGGTHSVEQALAWLEECRSGKFNDDAA